MTPESGVKLRIPILCCLLEAFFQRRCKVSRFFEFFNFISKILSRDLLLDGLLTLENEKSDREEGIDAILDYRKEKHVGSNVIFLFDIAIYRPKCHFECSMLLLLAQLSSNIFSPNLH